MKVQELRKDFIDHLSQYYGKEEARSFFYLLTEKYLGLKRVQVALSLEKVISGRQLELFFEVRKRLAAQEPIQYILGETEFYGLTFLVNQHVLIPRQETEELVDWIITDIHKTGQSKELKILDIGTGSGCIAISLAKNIPNADVYALDISAKALEIAKKNAKINEVNVDFVQSDILDIENLGKEFDIIVSNPPYVRELEKKEIMANVLENEPHLALFVPDTDPLIFYKKIATLAKKHLKPKGCLYFEINQYLGNEMVRMVEEMGYASVQLKKDINENNRMIKTKPIQQN